MGRIASVASGQPLEGEWSCGADAFDGEDGGRSGKFGEKGPNWRMESDGERWSGDVNGSRMYLLHVHVLCIPSHVTHT